MKHVVLSGPITGLDDYRERFAAAEKHARERWPGCRVWNPTRLLPDMDYDWYMGKCLDRIYAWRKHAPDAVILMLPGSAGSAGAMRERKMAEALGYDVVEWQGEDKPCLFCGGRETRTVEMAGGVFAVTCQKCIASGPIADSAEAARRAWNERAGQP